MLKDNHQFEDERNQNSKAVQQEGKSKFQEDKNDKMNPQKDYSTDKTVDQMENEPTNDHDPSIPSEGKGKPGMNMPSEKMPNYDMPDEELPAKKMPGEKEPHHDMPGEEKPRKETPGKEVPDEKLPGHKKPDEEMPGHNQDRKK